MYNRFGALSQSDNFIQVTRTKSKLHKPAIPVLMLCSIKDVVQWISMKSIFDIFHDRHNPDAGINGYMAAGLIDNFDYLGYAHGLTDGYGQDYLEFFDFTELDPENKNIYFIESFTDPVRNNVHGIDARNCGGYQAYRGDCSYIESVTGNIAHKDSFWKTMGYFRLEPIDPSNIPTGGTLFGTIESTEIQPVGGGPITTIELLPLCRAQSYYDDPCSFTSDITIFYYDQSNTWQYLTSIVADNSGSVPGETGVTATPVSFPQGTFDYLKYRIEMTVTWTDCPDDIIIQSNMQKTYVYSLIFKYQIDETNSNTNPKTPSRGFVAKNRPGIDSLTTINIDSGNNNIDKQQAGPALVDNLVALSKGKGSEAESYLAMVEAEQLHLIYDRDSSVHLFSYNAIDYKANPDGIGNEYLNPPADIVMGTWLYGTDYQPVAISTHPGGNAVGMDYPFSVVGCKYETHTGDVGSDWGGVDTYQWYTDYYAGNIFKDFDAARFGNMTILPDQVAFDSNNNQYFFTEQYQDLIWVYDYDDKKAQAFTLAISKFNNISTAAEKNGPDSQIGLRVNSDYEGNTCVTWIEQDVQNSTNIIKVSFTNQYGVENSYTVAQTTDDETTAGFAGAAGCPIEETRFAVLWKNAFWDDSIRSYSFKMYLTIFDTSSNCRTPPGQDLLHVFYSPWNQEQLLVEDFSLTKVPDYPGQLLLNVSFDYYTQARPTITPNYVDGILIETNSCSFNQLSSISGRDYPSQGWPVDTWINFPILDFSDLPGCDPVPGLPYPLGGVFNSQDVALNVFEGFVSAYRYSLKCLRNTPEEYSRIEFRSYERFGDDFNAVLPEPVLVFSAQMPYLDYERYNPTVSIAMKDLNNFFVVWETEHFPGSVGLKIQGAFVVDGVMMQNIDLNPSAENQMIIALAPQVLYYKNSYIVLWIEQDPSLESYYTIKARSYTYYGDVHETYTDEYGTTSLKEQILDVFTWSGAIKDLTLTASIDGAGNFAFAFPFDDGKIVPDIDSRIMRATAVRSGNKKLTIAPSPDGTAPTYLVITSADTDEVLIYDVNDPTFDWDADPPYTPNSQDNPKKIINLPDHPAIPQGCYPTAVDAGLVEFPVGSGTYVSRAFIALPGTLPDQRLDYFVAINVNGVSSDIIDASYKPLDIDNTGAVNPVDVAIRSDGEFVYFACYDENRVKVVHTKRYSVRNIVDEAGQAAIIDLPIGLALDEIKEAGARYYESIIRLIRSMPDIVFTTPGARQQLIDAVQNIIDNYDELNVKGTVKFIMRAEVLADKLITVSFYVKSIIEKLEYGRLTLLDTYLDPTRPTTYSRTLEGIIEGLPETLFNDQNYRQIAENKAKQTTNMLLVFQFDLANERLTELDEIVALHLIYSRIRLMVRELVKQAQSSINGIFQQFAQAVSLCQSMESTVSSLPDSAFKNNGARQSLLNKIDQTLDRCQAHDRDQALQKAQSLQSAIPSKVSDATAQAALLDQVDQVITILTSIEVS